jgi:hypothetical protein
MEAVLKTNRAHRLADALLFAQGDHALEEAVRQISLNEVTGNLKIARDWRLAFYELGGKETPEFQHAA